MNTIRVFLVLMALSHTTAHVTTASCTPPPCQIGPCIGLDLLVDGSFDKNCPQWEWNGATRERNGQCGRPWPGPDETWVAKLDTFGLYFQNAFWQDLVLPEDFGYSAEPFEVDVVWKVAGENASYWDRLRVRVYDVQTGALIETIGGLRGDIAPQTCSRYRLPVDESRYTPGQEIRLLFEAQVVTTGTAFYVDWVSFWWSTY